MYNMKQIFTKNIALLFFFIGSFFSAKAQIDVCVRVSNDSLVFAYKAKKDYTTAPINFWNSQLLTVRYPQNIALTWGGITQLSAFQWEEDPATPGAGVDGGDGFLYKTFYSANTPTQSFKKDALVQVFKVQFKVSKTLTFEPITNTIYTKKQHLDAAINNAVEPGTLSDGNIFNLFINCGPLKYNLDLPTDDDGDGVTSLTDPDDNNPCVPKSVTLVKVLATDMSDCATKNGTIAITASGTDTLFYSIDNGKKFVKTNTFTNLGYGTYQVIVKNKFGCLKTYSAPITIKCDSSICTDKIAPTFVLKHPILKNRKSGDSISMQCGYETVLKENIDITAIDNIDKNIVVKVEKESLTVVPACLNGNKMIMKCSWTATDNCKNKSTFLIYVLIKDTIAPKLVGVPQNITITDAKFLPKPPIVTADDKCDTNLKVTFTEEKSGDTLIIRKWSTGDMCGNYVIAVQKIKIKKIRTTPDVIDLVMYEGETLVVDIEANDLQGDIVKTDVLKQDKNNNAVQFQTLFFNDRDIEIFAQEVGKESITYGRYDSVNTCDTLHVNVTVKKRSQVITEGDDIIVYTGFSPNGDTENETFTIKNIQRYEDNSVYVYNRWGNEVYRSDNYKNDWNGTFRNKPLPDGTYFYIIKIPNRETLSGFVQINR